MTICSNSNFVFAKVYKIPIDSENTYKYYAIVNDKGEVLVHERQGRYGETDKVDIIYDDATKEQKLYYYSEEDFLKLYKEHNKIKNEDDGHKFDNYDDENGYNYNYYSEMYITNRDEYYNNIAYNNIGENTITKIFNIDGSENYKLEEALQNGKMEFIVHNKLYFRKSMNNIGRDDEYRFRDMKSEYYSVCDLDTLEIIDTEYKKIDKRYGYYICEKNKGTDVRDENFNIIKILEGKLLYQIKCGAYKYYCSEVKENMYNLLDENFEKVFEKNFVNKFTNHQYGDSDPIGYDELNKDIDGYYNDTMKILYLGQESLDFDVGEYILKYNLKNNVVDENTLKKMSEEEEEKIESENLLKIFNKEMPTSIEDEYKMADGKFYIMKNAKGEIVCDEEGNIASNYYKNIYVWGHNTRKGGYSIMPKREMMFCGDNENNIKYFCIENNGNGYIEKDINWDKQKGESPWYQGWGYYTDDFEDANNIYNVYTDKIINRYCKGYFNIFKFYDKLYFTSRSPIYRAPEGFMDIFDEEENSIDIYKNGVRFVNILCPFLQYNNLDENAYSENIKSKYMFGVTKNDTYVLGENFDVVKRINKKYSRLHIYNEGEKIVYQFEIGKYEKERRYDYYDSNMNLIVENVLAKEVVTNNKLLNVKKGNIYFSIRYKISENLEEIKEMSFRYDELKKEYVKDDKVIVWDTEIKGLNKKLYLAQKEMSKRGSQYYRYNIYDEKGKIVFENINYYHYDRLTDEIKVDYLVITDENSTKIYDKNLKIYKDFNDKIKFYIKGPFDNFYNAKYNIENDNVFYIEFNNEDGTIEGVVDNNYNIIKQNAVDEKKHIIKNVIEENEDYILVEDGFDIVMMDNSYNEILRVSKFDIFSGD